MAPWVRDAARGRPTLSEAELLVRGADVAAASGVQSRLTCSWQRASAAGFGLFLMATAASTAVMARKGAWREPAIEGRSDRSVDKLEVKPGDCLTVAMNESSRCRNEIMHAKAHLTEQPEEYPGLDSSSSLMAIQAFLHYQHKCPEPCWGQGDDAPEELHHLSSSHRKRAEAGAPSHSAAKGSKAKPAHAHSRNHAPAEDDADDAEEEGQQKQQKHQRQHKEEEQEEGEDEDCVPVAPGSTCFKNVDWVMKTGLFTHPEWYRGLTKDSTFQDVQAQLQGNADAKCPKPCDCNTAQPGDECDEKVSWVLREGIVKHPEWYKGITATSPRREIQRQLHDQDPKSACRKPCKEKVREEPKPLEPPSLFCFAVTQPHGAEMELVQAQIKKKVGIFACDGFALLCQEQMHVQGIATIKFEPAEVGESKDGTAGNAQLFMNVWRAVGEDGRFENHDWTIKVDPDTVLLPDRLRQHLMQPVYAGATDEATTGAFVKQCSKWQGEGWPAMFGSIEAISKPAVREYLAGVDRCRSQLQWQDWGEDLFLASCFDQVLGVRAIPDITISGDDVCKGEGSSAGLSRGANCGDGKTASYHPFKTVAKWFACFDEAGR